MGGQSVPTSPAHPAVGQADGRALRSRRPTGGDGTSAPLMTLPCRRLQGDQAWEGGTGREPLRVAGIDPGRHQGGDEIPGLGGRNGGGGTRPGSRRRSGAGVRTTGSASARSFARHPSSGVSSTAGEAVQRHQALPGEDVADRRGRPPDGARRRRLGEDRGQSRDGEAITAPTAGSMAYPSTWMVRATPPGRRPIRARRPRAPRRINSTPVSSPARPPPTTATSTRVGHRLTGRRDRLDHHRHVLGGGVWRSIPWPRLNTCPGRPPTRSSTSPTRPRIVVRVGEQHRRVEVALHGDSRRSRPRRRRSGCASRRRSRSPPPRDSRSRAWPAPGAK